MFRLREALPNYAPGKHATGAQETFRARCAAKAFDSARRKAHKWCDTLRT